MDYRNRIAKTISWVEDSYPTYFEDGTREVSEEELQDPRSFHHKNKRDLHYTGLNVNILQAFLGANKFKTPTEKNPRTDVYVSHGHLRKYDDAIKWGAGILPINGGISP